MDDLSAKDSGGQANILEARFHPVGHTNIEPMLLKISSKPILIGRTAASPGTKGSFSLTSLVTSRKHAVIWAQNGKIYIKDNHSSTGTYVNGQRIGKESSTSNTGRALYDQDIIRFGEDLEINGVTHKSEMFRVEFPVEKDREVRDIEKKIVELKMAAKDNYEDIWCDITKGVYSDMEEHINDRVPKNGNIRKIIARIQSPGSADVV